MLRWRAHWKRTQGIHRHASQTKTHGEALMHRQALTHSGALVQRLCFNMPAKPYKAHHHVDMALLLLLWPSAVYCKYTCSVCHVCAGCGHACARCERAMCVIGASGPCMC
eukprot:360648-Chlamydomonas_euryale.AAC.5